MNSEPLLESPECDLTLFVACYNEEQAIIPTLETVIAAVDEANISYEIIVIDDCSKDNSVKLVRQFIDAHPDLPITLYVNGVNQGLAVNFSEAAFRGHGKYYRLICGDNVESRDTLVSIFKHIGQADMILPYPAVVKGRSASRRIVSRTFTRIVNFLSGYNIRYYNGLTVNLRYNVMRWHSNSHGFGFQAELVTRLLDMDATYVEVPVTQEERAEGTSKAFTLRNILSVSHSLVEIFIRRVGRIMYPGAKRQPLSTLHIYRAGSSGNEQTLSTIEEVTAEDRTASHANSAVHADGGAT